MLKIHRIATTSFRTWGFDITQPEDRPASTTNSTPEYSFQGAESWVDVNEEPATVSASTQSGPASVYSGDSRSISRTDLQRDTPMVDPTLSGTRLATDSHILDTVSFPPHATHLLPSEPNGTWYTKIYHTIRTPSEAASTLREVLEQHAHELDVPTLLCKLEQVAEDRKADSNEWLNQTFADYDLVEMHDRVRRLVPVISMPNLRQIDHAVDAVVDIAQSLRKRRSEPDLLDDTWGDKYTFARIVGQKARRALIKQGICKEWQFLSEEHARLQHSMELALIRTFARIEQLHQHVPLFQAKPHWVADRTKEIWRLELDVGVVSVEDGPESGRSLVDLRSINTGFGLPESSGCVTIADLDRQAQDVEGCWQLVEL